MNRFGIVALVLVAGCSHAEQGGAEKSTGAPSSVTATPQAASAPVAKKAAEEAFPENPQEKFSEGEKAFARVREAILKEYYLSGVTEDEIYRAAAQGVLEHVDPKMHKWNKLLSPPDVAELR